MKVSVYKRAVIKEVGELTDGEVFIMNNSAYMMLSDSGFFEEFEDDEYPVVNLEHGLFFKVKENQEVIVPDHAELIIGGPHCNPDKITNEI